MHLLHSRPVPCLSMPDAGVSECLTMSMLNLYIQCHGKRQHQSSEEPPLRVLCRLGPMSYRGNAQVAYKGVFSACIPLTTVLHSPPQSATDRGCQPRHLCCERAAVPKVSVLKQSSNLLEGWFRDLLQP
mmetsp:Transcript_43801/g.102227  ORF Transcript_43801/g.102227 Transcript_43801/m.102227 type:complete len:129 (+) Transcript_43801:721-1107(+)